jgi:predicted DNA-binding antitoxin AbrB/MazE fold protein
MPAQRPNVPFMIRTVEAIYEDGVLRLPAPLPLPNCTHVIVTIETEPVVAEDAERATWLKASERVLIETWNNTADDVFNELLKR